MAESSIFWTTGSTGDGASPYTQDQVVAWLRRTFISDQTTEGVLLGYANQLAPSGSSSPVTIGTGAAIVYGFPYDNTAAVSVTIPTPAIGTTGHRIVLRVNWTAQTVRIALKSSADGVASIPALTQSAGVTWEISLATLTITTGGAITLTDARGFAHPNLKVGTDNIDDGAVDDTKVGNRVPQFIRRQGDNASDWSYWGTTTYTPGSVRMQAGAVLIQIPSGYSSASSNVTLPTAFSAKPVVFTSVHGEDGAIGEIISIEVTAVTASGFTLTAYSTGTSELDVYAFWLAIGPE
jgi:hypothetical protein